MYIYWGKNCLICDNFKFIKYLFYWGNVYFYFIVKCSKILLDIVLFLNYIGMLLDYLEC